MFCRNCGAQIPDGATSCPACHAVEEANVAPEKTEEKAGIKNMMSGFKAPTKSGKSFAVTATALTLIPAIFIFTIDFVWNLKFDWAASGFIIGALLVIWVCSVLPALHITPAPVTAGICFLSVALYLLYIVKRFAGSMEWFTMFALPLLMIVAVFIGVDSALSGNTNLRGSGMWAVISGEGAIFCIAWGILWVNYHGVGVLQPRISVIFASLCLIGAVVFGAGAYINKIRKQ